MSRFYGTLTGQAKTTATRRGSSRSGVTVQAAGYGGAIRVEVFAEGDEDRFTVTLIPWQASGGGRQLLAEGTLDARGEVRLRQNIGEGGRAVVIPVDGEQDEEDGAEAAYQDYLDSYDHEVDDTPPLSYDAWVERYWPGIVAERQAMRPL